MKRNLLFVLAVVALSCFNGCGSSNESTEIQGVTFVNKGSVAPHAVSTTVTIDSQNIKYQDSQAGQPVSGWSRQIQFADYTSMQRVVTNYNLLERGNVTLPPGQPICVGGSGMTVTITTNKIIHSFDINADVMCDRSIWPEGVRNLVALEEVLVNKYASIIGTH